MKYLILLVLFLNQSITAATEMIEINEQCINNCEAEKDNCVGGEDCGSACVKQYSVCRRSCIVHIPETCTSMCTQQLLEGI